jgi:hypothetical protein
MPIWIRALVFLIIAPGTYCARVPRWFLRFPRGSAHLTQGS